MHTVTTDTQQETMIQRCLYSSLIALLAMPTTTQAQTISPDAAAQIAAKYIQQVLPQRATRATHSQPYYVFNDGDGEGFVIVASDGRMHEIVGRSSTGSISATDMPPALQAYLESYTDYVKALATSTSHHKVLTSTDAVAPLLTTKWNQQHPYNNLAPTLGVGGQRPPIGCVATAMSQVMNYHKWPLKGMGTVSYKPSYQLGELDYGTQQVDFSKSEYAWHKMTDRNETPEAAAAVAKLMYDVSVAVRMDYKPTGSGATMERAIDALTDNFDYDALLVKRNALPSGTFIELLRNELRAGYPVIFSGDPELGGSGHAWVCDGFDKNGLFSMNWGWGGMSDGYFDLSYLNPHHRGEGGDGVGGFNRGQDFICVRPKREDARPLPTLRVGLDFNELGWMRADKNVTTKSEGFELTLNNLGNFSSRETYLSRIAVGVFRRLDEAPIHVFDLGDTYQETSRHLQYEASFLEVKERITFSHLSDGEYYLYPLTKTLDREATWHKTQRPCYLKIRIAGHKVTIIERADQPALRLLAQPQGSTEVPSGQWSEYKLHLANTSTLHFRGDLQIVLRGEGKEYVYQPQNSSFRFMDNTSEQRIISVSFPSEMPTGEYEMTFRFDYSQVSAGSTADGNQEVAQSETPLKVKVWNTEASAYLQHIGTYVINGNVAIDTDFVDISQYPELQLFVRTNNVGQHDFQGQLAYVVEDLLTQTRKELKRIDYLVPKRGGVVAQLPIISLKDYLEHLEIGHHYRLIVEAYSDEERRYEWPHHQVLSITAPTTAASHDINDNLIEYHATTQSLHLHAQRPIDCLAIYAINGTLALRYPHLLAGVHGINLSQLPAGAYIVVWHTERQRHTLRIVR